MPFEEECQEAEIYAILVRAIDALADQVLLGHHRIFPVIRQLAAENGYELQCLPAEKGGYLHFVKVRDVVREPPLT